LHWIYEGEITNDPKEKVPSNHTRIKRQIEHFFKTPIEATLAIFPICFWEIITIEINRYANQKLQSKKGKKLIAGYKWKPVSLPNVMTYFDILILWYVISPNRAENEGSMGLSIPECLD